MKNLLSISLLAFLLSGCTYRQFSGFHHVTDAGISPKDIKPWLSQTSGSVLFRTEIEAYNNHFGGIMVINSTETGSNRIVYVTELGMKVFDMEFSGNEDFTIHYCMDALNRKIIIKTLKEDLGLVTGKIPEKERLKISENTESRKLLFRTGAHPGKYFYTVDTHSLRIIHILKTGCLFKKTDIDFAGNNQSEIDSISIVHHNIKLQIHLSRFRQQDNDVSE